MHTSRSFRVLAAAVFLSLSINMSGCFLLIGGAVAGGAAGTVESAKDSRHEEHPPMAYVGTVLANVVYVPTKVVFAGVGALTSGVTYLATLGNGDTSQKVWDASVGGNYVVTPSMIEGQERVHFVG